MSKSGKEYREKNKSGQHDRNRRDKRAFIDLKLPRRDDNEKRDRRAA